MFLLEYKAKEIFKKKGIPVPRGDVTASPHEAKEIARKLDCEVFIKVQVAAGGRGKGGGVQLAQNPEDAERKSSDLLSRPFQGEKVRNVLIEEKIQAAQEFYAGLIDNRATGGPVAILSPHGGMDVEEIVNKYPDRVIRFPFSLIDGIPIFKIRQLARLSGIESTDLQGFSTTFHKLWEIYRDYDANMVEINPLVVTKDGKFIALDAKMVIDDDALFRHNDLKGEEDLDLNERERFAREKGYGYVEFNLNGKIACAATGAGLGITSMDLISDIAPQALAFFLDVGGRFVQSTGDVLKLAAMFPSLKAILLNRYGGFGRGEIIAESIVKGLLEVKPRIPVMVHLSGSGEKGAIDCFKKMESRIREAGITFEWTSHTVSGKESQNARKGGVDIIEYPVRRVIEWAGYEYRRNPPDWFPQRKDWEEDTRRVLREALAQRPEPEYRKLAEVE
jgi:succinyl-CoA synthetase beta subunit